MGYIHSIQTGETTHRIEPTLFAVTNGTSSNITASITDFELASGVLITLQIRYSNDVAATLTINNGTAKSIYYQGAAIEANILKQGYIYNLVYDGNVWHVTGTRHSNNEMVLPHKLTFGSDRTYEYDGSADVTVPVYGGTTL